MDLFKQAVALTESATPTTVKEVVDLLSQALVGKTINAGMRLEKYEGTKKEKKTFKITKVRGHFLKADDGEPADAKGIMLEGNIDIYLEGYKATRDGWIYYSDGTFEKELKTLIKGSTAGTYMKSMFYSEQGMQGSNFVNLDFIAKLPKVAKPVVKEDEEVLEEDIHSQIKKQLDAGKVVRSKALGRVGDIISVKDGSVYIKLKGGKQGVTTFKSGDKVKLEKNGEDYHVVNDDEEEAKKVADKDNK